MSEDLDKVLQELEDLAEENKEKVIRRKFWEAEKEAKTLHYQSVMLSWAWRRFLVVAGYAKFRRIVCKVLDRLISDTAP